MSSIEDRLVKLETAVFGPGLEPSRDEWQATVGMFDGDAVMKQIHADVEQSRQQEREEAHQRAGDQE